MKAVCGNSSERVLDSTPPTAPLAQPHPCRGGGALPWPLPAPSARRLSDPLPPTLGGPPHGSQHPLRAPSAALLAGGGRKAVPGRPAVPGAWLLTAGPLKSACCPEPHSASSSSHSPGAAAGLGAWPLGRAREARPAQWGPTTRPPHHTQAEGAQQGSSAPVYRASPKPPWNVTQRLSGRLFPVLSSAPRPAVLGVVPGGRSLPEGQWPLTPPSA